MVNLHTLLLFFLATSYVAVAWDPDCTAPEYYQGVAYIKSDEFCGVYYMCYRNPYYYDKFKFQVMCCPNATSFDKEHQTCVWDPYCQDSREKCPEPRTTTNLPCPEHPHPTDKTKFINWVTYIVRQCPYGLIWDQDKCTCVPGKWVEPDCDTSKILQFDFDGTFDSHVCYQWVPGTPYGNPSIDGGFLTLNGLDQFLRIDRLANWFSWNPQADHFTWAMWVYHADPQLTAGLFGIYGAKGNMIAITIEEGVLFAEIRGTRVEVGSVPANVWWEIEFSCWREGPIFRDLIWVGYSGSAEGGLKKEFNTGPVTHTNDESVTLGFVPGMPPFKGSIDRFTFWDRALSDEELYSFINTNTNT